MSPADLASRLEHTSTRTIVLACFALAALAGTLGAALQGEKDWFAAWALVAIPNLVVLWRTT
jgi:hypothetical protein